MRIRTYYLTAKEYEIFVHRIREEVVESDGINKGEFDEKSVQWEWNMVLVANGIVK